MKALLGALMLVLSLPAAAEWVKVTATNDATIYLDPATILKEGNVRKVWLVQDLKQKGKRGEMSRRVLSEYDCKDKRHRMLAISEHSAPMGGGQKLVAGDEADQWGPIPPGTTAAAVSRIVCEKP